MKGVTQYHANVVLIHKVVAEVLRNTQYINILVEDSTVTEVTMDGSSMIKGNMFFS